MSIVPARRSWFRRSGALLLSASVAAVGALAAPALPARAGGLVDPSTFVPRPPSTAECREHGGSVACRTRFTFDDGPVPVADLPCGTVYEIVTIPRDIRSDYVDGLLVGRHVTSHVDGVWSLSPSGQAPSVRVGGGWNWRTELTVPGDESTARITTHGNQLKLGQGLARYANVAGISYPDDGHRGPLILDVFETEEAQAALCAALTG